LDWRKQRAKRRREMSGPWLNPYVRKTTIPNIYKIGNLQIRILGKKRMRLALYGG